jgi:hypothetical protein
MSSRNDDYTNITLYISILTGLLLTISETLPYVQNINGNGIIHLITNFLIKKTLTNNLVNNNEERQPLINNNFTNPQSNNTHHNNTDDIHQGVVTNGVGIHQGVATTHLLSEVSNITITSQSVNFTFHSPNVKLDFNETSNFL